MEPKESRVFLFINPSSGGNRASAFTRAGVNRVTLAPPLSCQVFIHDIREGPSGQKPGFILLKKILETYYSDRSPPISKASSFPQKTLNQNVESEAPDYAENSGTHVAATLIETESTQTRPNSKTASKPNDLVRVLVAGGDGTVMWCTSEFMSHGIDDSKVAIGVIPYGTGNDFAKAFGWKKYESCRPFDERMQTMRELLQVWLEAEVVSHDLWDIGIFVNEEDGRFCKIDSVMRKKKILKEGDKCITRMDFMMSNYFSIGVESRIGIGFDRHRTQNQCCNKLRYMIEGLKKSTFKRNMKVNDIVDSLTDSARTDTTGNEMCIFTTNPKLTTAPLLKPAMSLIALNIPSFGSGNNIWRPSKKLAVKIPDDAASKKICSEILKLPQGVGDSILEFLSFPSTSSLGLEFALKGQGSRIYQGTGPFTIYFKDSLKPTDRVYFQVDGEFFHMQKPKRATIVLNRKIQALRRS